MTRTFSLFALFAFLLALVLSPADTHATRARGSPPVPVGRARVHVDNAPVQVFGLPVIGQAARGDTLDGGHDVRPATIAPDGTVADPTDDLAKLAVMAIDAIRSGNWWLLASLALSVVLACVRKFGPGLLASKWPAGAAWIKSDVGGAVLVLGLGMVGGVTTALVGGAPIGAALLLDAVKVSLGSAGGFVVVKKLFGFSQDKVAEAGAKAVDQNPPGGVGTVLGDASKPLGS